MTLAHQYEASNQYCLWMFGEASSWNYLCFALPTLQLSGFICVVQLSIFLRSQASTFGKRHILADSSIDGTVQRRIVTQVLAVNSVSPVSNLCTLAIGTCWILYRKPFHCTSHY